VENKLYSISIVISELSRGDQKAPRKIQYVTAYNLLWHATRCIKERFAQLGPQILFLQGPIYGTKFPQDIYPHPNLLSTLLHDWLGSPQSPNEICMVYCYIDLWRRIHTPIMIKVRQQLLGLAIASLVLPFKVQFKASKQSNMKYKFAIIYILEP
jgi:hypothetical protein